MATAQKQRNCMSAVVFPKTIGTEQQSLMLVKRLLAVAVSCITYLRGIFPESAYGTRYMDDVCVKILREDKNCPGSSQLVKWMLGCYDALQKKYLRQIVLAVYTQPEDPQTVTECYHFKFKYTQHGPLLDFGRERSGSPIPCADTKRASILLIRKIFVLMQNLSPLPSDVCLTMKLLYYDEVTPPDYQPPGFREAECEGLMFNEEPTYLNVGEVPTPFHLLKLKITTEKQRMENVDKNILRQGRREEPGGESQAMNEDPVPDDKVAEENQQNVSEAQETNSTCGEEAGGIHTPNVSNPQVDHLARKTSELVVSESRTRSGKIFQSCLVHQAELSSSQDVLPKRRKLSEPKEQF
ncbi:HORMA domain-containing protein 1 [Empidonax traillii]|uniref:HORMA domain-containing protein 1 n=1 Tax=Empidonax traillii TaxID=164674 RepID=UPI000FFD5D4C|nr:HORMA domain-containing protein 1 [Empidonax traillii]XP_027765092.1 HORMA domain-containing protein 1 [Empidonax traillii]XP_027765093.1 HORMA domain-containing protein 1 [Empidonax traillii]XP_027765094.1 HORMA domain-containing protein 1 [Empidonax traillii]XP_027765097.1 HORMA domain-containing protein 1 [Empidonax traillii]